MISPTGSSRRPGGQHLRPSIRCGGAPDRLTERSPDVEHEWRCRQFAVSVRCVSAEGAQKRCLVSTGCGEPVPTHWHSSRERV
jgi:hypothetical protein